jgi:hypothetical protein
MRAHRSLNIAARSLARPRLLSPRHAGPEPRPGLSGGALPPNPTPATPPTEACELSPRAGGSLFPNSIPCHSYKQTARNSACNSFGCHSYKSKGLKVLCLPLLRETGGRGAEGSAPAESEIRICRHRRLQPHKPLPAITYRNRASKPLCAITYENTGGGGGASRVYFSLILKHLATLLAAPSLVSRHSPLVTSGGRP